MTLHHKEYIDELKSKYPTESLPVSKDIFNPEFQSYFEIREKDYQADPEKYLDYLYDNFLKATLPAFINDEVEKGNVIFLLSGNLEPEVFIKKFPEQYAIVATQGLQRLVFRVLRILSTSIQTINDTSNNRKSFKEIGYKMGEVFWWLKETKMPWGPSYNASVFQIEYASNLTTVVELFFLAHEFAHMMFDVCRKKGNKNMDFIKGNEEELQADFYAARFCYNITTIPKIIIIPGVELGLYILEGLEKIGFDMGGYPPIQERLKMVRSAFVIESNGDFDKLYSQTILSRDFDKIFHWSMESIFKCNSDEDPDFATMEKKKKEDFHKLLNQHFSFNLFDNSFCKFINEGLMHIVYYETILLVQDKNKTDLNKQVIERLTQFFSIHINEVPVSPHFLKVLSN